MKRVVTLILFTLTLRAYDVIDIEKTKYYYETNSALFIDARDFKKYYKGTIAKAINVPLKRYKRFKKFLPIDKSATIVIFCGGVDCNLSKKLSFKLEKLGYTNIKQFSEGYPKWKALNLPIIAKPIKCKNQKPKKVVINGIKLMLNSDNTINKEWFNSIKSFPKGLIVVDVRDKEHFNKAHIKGAINLPFKDSIDTAKLKDAKAIIFYCNSGIISTNAKESLNSSLKRKTFIIDDTLVCNSGCLFK